MTHNKMDVPHTSKYASRLRELLLTLLLKEEYNDWMGIFVLLLCCLFFMPSWLTSM